MQKEQMIFKHGSIAHYTPDLDPPGQRKENMLVNLGIRFKWRHDVNTVMPE